MSDDSQPPQPQLSTPAAAEPPQDHPVPTVHSPDAQIVAEVLPFNADRSQLLDRARSFLQSPQVRYEDNAAKHRFLVEKGLNDVEIQGLLQELVSVVLRST